MISRLENDVYQIILPQGKNSTVNAYYLNDINVLVDTGTDEIESWQTLCNDLENIGRDINDVDTILITHHHIDHVGGLKYLKHKKVYAPKGVKYYSSTEYVSDISTILDKMLLSSKFYLDIETHLRNEIMKDYKINYIDQLLFPEIKIISLQGHSSEDYIYIYKDKFIFSGDIVLSKIFFNCIFDLNPKTRNIFHDQRKLYRNELTVIENLCKDDKIFCLGHSRNEEKGISSKKVLKIISQNKRRMRRTEKKIKNFIDEKNNISTIEFIVDNIFENFIKYSLFLPFGEVSSVLDELQYKK